MGTLTCTVTYTEPILPLFLMSGAPFSGMRKVRPGWVPAGMESLTSVPSGMGTLALVPSAASYMLTGKSMRTSAPSRLKTGWLATLVVMTRSPRGPPLVPTSPRPR